MSYSVGELSSLANVSVRTLHHYDDVGLLRPSQRTRAGYRRYSHDDLERLHRILVYRELGFDLARIARILDDPAVDALEHLRRQRALLAEQGARLQRMVRTVEAMMAAKQNGYNMSEQELREAFGTFDPRQYEDEAAARWGDTAAYQESVRRTKQYSKDQWVAIGEEAEQVTTAFADAMARGVAPNSDEAMDLAERHRQHISRWFYECGYDVHRGLADMYVADPRFRKHYNDMADGLSDYICAAVHANCARAAQ